MFDFFDLKCCITHNNSDQIEGFKKNIKNVGINNCNIINFNDNYKYNGSYNYNYSVEAPFGEKVVVL